MRCSSQSLGTTSLRPAPKNAEKYGASFDKRLFAIGLWVFAGYYLGAKLGFALTFKASPVSVLWPPNSVLVAALLLTPPRIWWFVLLVAFPAHCAAELQSHVPPLMSLCWFISNCTEALLGAGLTRYLAGERIQFTSLRNAGIFCLCVVFAGPFLSSFLDAAFVRWNAWGQSSFWELVRIRFFSNTLAALIVAPLILTWANGIGSVRVARRERLLEACILLVGLSSISFVVLYKFGPPPDTIFLFLTLPFLLWAAARFGSLGISTALSIVGFLAIWSAAYGHGPFSGGTAEENALSIQIFLIVLSIPMLFLGAVIEERAIGVTVLNESESRFRIVADAAPVLIWMAGTDKLCNFFNKPWLDFTGRTLEQETGNGWAEGVHADDLQRCLETYREAFDSRQSFVMQYRLRRFDKEYRWVSDQGVPRYDSNGNFAGYIGSCVDVTDLIKKDEALREFEERVVLAAEATHHGVWEMDTTTKTFWMSDKARSLFQFEPGTPIDESMYQSRVHPDDRALREGAVRQAIKTQGEYAIEYRVLLPDGTLRWISGRGRCLPGKHGKGTRLIGVSVDVTPQKQAQDVFRLAADGLHLGVWHWDETAKTLAWDKATRTLFGVSADAEITIETFYSAVHPDDRERVKQNWSRALELRLPYHIEFRTRRMDGTIRWADARGRSYYDESGKPLSITGVVFDVTDRKEAELAAQRSREELGHLSRVAAMGQLAASIAHELNQPLSGITSNASAGQRFIDRGQVDLREIRELLGDIVSDGRRAGDVIRGLQTMVKKGITTRQEVNLNDLVMNVVRMAKPDAVLRSCALGTFLDPDLPTVEGDPVQLQQVLLNLIVNAFDATSDTAMNQRKVVISTERDGHSAIRVSVRDYGFGIAEDVRLQMFDQFFTTKLKGLGMGLSIAQSIIESHGGIIAAENVDGGGARFHFTLPVQAQASSP
jgi:PAS domain S-box-containing protein